MSACDDPSSSLPAAVNRPIQCHFLVRPQLLTRIKGSLGSKVFSSGRLKEVRNYETFNFVSIAVTP
jgi:hypothetical protein